MKPGVLLGMIRGAEIVAEALLRGARVEIITLYEPGSRRLRAAEIEHRSFDDFISEQARERVIQEAEPRFQSIVSQLYGPDMRRAWPQYDAATWTALRTEVVQAIKRDLMEEMLTIDTVRRCVSETDLRLILTAEDYSRDTRTAILAAQRLGIPALHLLHGYPYGTQNAHDIVTADMTAAYSEPCKKIVESFGADPARVVVTGNPLWDHYAGPPLPGVKEEVCARMGLDPTRPIIEYALTNVHGFSAISAVHPVYHIQTAAAVIDAFARLAQRHSDWQFVLRPHPSDAAPVERLRERAREAGLAAIFIDTEASDQVLAAVDVFLCTHSNMGIEALLCGKPVINVAIDEWGGPVFREGLGPLFIDSDAVLFARSADDIAPLVEAALLDDATRRRLREGRPASVERLNYANDGRAGERLCAVALEMIADGAKYVRPVDRYPEFEPGLAQAVPLEAQRVLVLGRAAQYVAGAIESRLPAAVITAAALPPPETAAPYDAVVLSDPIPHDEGAEELLETARGLCCASGVVALAFRRGASPAALHAYAEGRWVPGRPNGEAPDAVGQYSRVGVALVLSRSGLEVLQWGELDALGNLVDRSGPQAPEVDPDTSTGPQIVAWMVCAQPRPNRPSAYAEARQVRKRRADVHNRMGERRYAQGDMVGAVKAFTSAIQFWNEDPVYFGNMAAALFGAQHYEQAWEQIQEALHVGPHSPSVRANYRQIAAALGYTEKAEEVLRRFGSDVEA